MLLNLEYKAEYYLNTINVKQLQRSLLYWITSVVHKYVFGYSLYSISNWSIFKL